MRPPWEIHAGAPDDVESLQTDVMRCVAIIGLCLTAIFSLVNAAHDEGPRQAAPESTPAAEAVTREVAIEPREPEQLSETTQPLPEDVVPAAPERLAEPLPPVPAPPEPREYTLEFASTQALETLRRQGAVSVYAIAGDAHWLIGTDGRSREVQAPSSYYRMHADTLPDAFASLAQDLPHAVRAWAVTLPANVIARIEEIASGQEGGALVIDAQGGVTLER